jgi:hypothetical protein
LVQFGLTLARSSLFCFYPFALAGSTVLLTDNEAKLYRNHFFCQGFLLANFAPIFAFSFFSPAFSDKQYLLKAARCIISNCAAMSRAILESLWRSQEYPFPYAFPAGRLFSPKTGIFGRKTTEYTCFWRFLSPNGLGAS